MFDDAQENPTAVSIEHFIAGLAVWFALMAASALI